MALPTTNITTTLVAQTIGLASNSVNVLCAGKLPAENISASRINKWSKYKPVRYDSVAPDRSGTWWRATDGNCGINVINYGTMAGMFSALRAGVSAWEYLPPLGIHGQPCRLADFRLYSHTALPPLVPLSLNDVYYATNRILGCTLAIRSSDEFALTLEDIGDNWNLAEMYFGVAISKQGSSTFKYMTESTTISSGSGGSIDIPIDGELGMYDVVYFLAETAKTSFTSPDIANTFIPIPGALQVVEIRSGDLGVYFGGGTYFEMGRVYYQLIFNNVGNGGKTLNNCYIDIKYGDNIDGPSQVGEASFKIHTPEQADGIVYAPGNAKTTISGSLLGVLPDFDPRGGYIKFNTSTNDAYNTGVRLYAGK